MRVTDRLSFGMTAVGNDAAALLLLLKSLLAAAGIEPSSSGGGGRQAGRQFVAEHRTLEFFFLALN